MTFKSTSTLSLCRVDDAVLTIGELAQRSGVSTATLRYYDRLGLLRPAERSEGGYRLFGVDEEQRLRFILRAKALDLSLDEIRSLLDVWDHGSCGETRWRLRHVVAHKVAEARRRAQEAEHLAVQLALVYRRLSEDVTGDGEHCTCVPELPTGDVPELDDELARIAMSACTCGAGCCWGGCECGCSCCAAAISMTSSDPRKGGDTTMATITREDLRPRTDTTSCACCTPAGAESSDGRDHEKAASSSACGCGCGGACGCGSP